MFDWAQGLVERGGYLALALLMLLENVFPPLPSELIMPLAGFTAGRGDMNLWLAIAAGSAGSLLGAVFWFYVGRWVGLQRLERWAARHGRWLTLTPDEVRRAKAWFDRHGGGAVLFGRLVPAVRTLISVPAGLSDMSLPRLLAYSLLGTAVWTGLLAGAGYLLGAQYDRVESWLSPVTNVVVGALVVYYLYRVLTFSRRARAAEQHP